MFCLFIYATLCHLWSYTQSVRSTVPIVLFRTFESLYIDGETFFLTPKLSKQQQYIWRLLFIPFFWILNYMLDKIYIANMMKIWFIARTPARPESIFFSLAAASLNLKQTTDNMLSSAHVICQWQSNGEKICSRWTEAERSSVIWCHLYIHEASQ